MVDGCHRGGRFDTLTTLQSSLDMMFTPVRAVRVDIATLTSGEPPSCVGRTAGSDAGSRLPCLLGALSQLPFTTKSLLPRSTVFPALKDRQWKKHTRPPRPPARPLDWIFSLLLARCMVSGDQPTVEADQSKNVVFETSRRGRGPGCPRLSGLLCKLRSLHMANCPPRTPPQVGSVFGLCRWRCVTTLTEHELKPWSSNSPGICSQDDGRRS
jgi:hypothetical protein